MQYKLTDQWQSTLIISVAFIAALTGVFFFMEQAAGVAFPAFDVMDFLIRVLPGGIITFGIDMMVDFLLLFTDGDDLDSTAKTAESLMAVFQFIGIGTVLGLGYGAIANVLRNRGTFLSSEWSTGLIIGAALGIPVAVISAQYNTSASASPLISTFWILVASLIWGLFHNYAQRRLTPPTPAAETPQNDSGVSDAAFKQTENNAYILDRRQFLIQVGAASAAVTVSGASLGALFGDSETVQGANVIDEAILNTGLEPAPGTRPEYTPLQDHYRIDINSGRFPNVDELEYRLPIDGLVDNPLSLSLANIREDYDVISENITMSCISNRIAGGLISTTQWTGAPLRDILADANLQEDGKFLLIESFDGFDEVVEIEMIMNDERILLAYEWDGVPLPGKHGFPLRVHIPDRYGMKQPKWIEKMTVIDEWQEGYWVRRGWDKDAIVKMTSVIDTVAVDNVYTDDEGVQRVPIGGIAYSGAKEISAVEVRINDGEWQPAQLRTPLSDRTWVIWRFDWPFEAGEHTFTVRAFDGEGVEQIAEVADRRPSGATGYHSETEDI